MSAGPTGERTSLLGQLAAEWLPFPLPLGRLPDATPADGPDPYGERDSEWLRIDWSQHLRRIDVPMPSERAGANGSRPTTGTTPTRVHYAEMGPDDAAKLAVVLVHGLSGSWQNWLENIPHLARRRRVIALDLPGFGDSPMPPWTLSIESYGRLLHRFCEAIGVEDCVVIGNSMGGFISAEAAIVQPGRFERLGLVAAAGISHARMRRQPIETSARMAAAVTPLVLKAQARALRRSRVRWATFRGIFHRPQRLRPELLIEQFQHGAGKPGFLPAVSGLVGYDILDRLGEIDVPALVVWGRNDRIVPAHDALAYAKRIRDARLVILDGTGHCPQLERPVRFNRLLDGFLADA